MLIGLEKTEEGFISSFPKKKFPQNYHFGMSGSNLLRDY